MRLIYIVTESLNSYVSSIMKSKFRRIISLMLISVAIIGLAMPLGEDILCAGEQPDAKSV